MESFGAFFSDENTSLRLLLLASVFLALNSGLLGSFVILRRVALVGDALSHAVLPGVALALLFTLRRDPVLILVSALVSGLLSAGLFYALERYSRLGRETLIGIVLVSFYSLGGVLFSLVERAPSANKAGLRDYLFGHASALSHTDVTLLAGSSLLIVGLMSLFFKEFSASTLDRSFARVLGMPVAFLNGLFIFLLTLHIVLSLQAVGIVLVSALIVIPAATGYLLFRDLAQVIWSSIAFAFLACLGGGLLSYTLPGFSTGPLMALLAAGFFGLVFVFHPYRGELAKLYDRFFQQGRYQRENALKSIYKLAESQGFITEQITIRDYAAFRNYTLGQARREVRDLERRRYLGCSRDRSMFALTPQGWLVAGRIVRNHRLWELYLHHIEKVPENEVHVEAEYWEHRLDESVVLELEKLLKHPKIDPHGRKIPSLLDMKDLVGIDAADLENPRGLKRRPT